ncbi:MAG: serine hydrolase [Gammaproteobacteria bacterium]|nr:serine hydrolase [Gammaproteobacteria bacterium]
MRIKKLACMVSIAVLMACSNEPKAEVAKAESPTKVATTDQVDQSYQQLDDFFNALAAEDRVLGSFAIYQDGKEAFDKAYIIEDDKVTETKDSYRYKIGSISKTFTSTLVFQVIEEGKLSLDTKLSEYFPEIQNAEKITIKMMLNHHSGIFNYTNHDEFQTYYQEPQTNAQMVARIKTYEPAFEPGEKGEYSNSNYLLLGYILEAISGKDYGQLIAEKIVQPLGLKETYLESVTEPEKNEVFSYMNRKGWEKIPQWEMSSADAAGAIVSSTHDLNVFYKGLFDGKLISESSLKTMITEEDNMGHGIFKREVDLGDKEAIGYWHNGRIENFSSGMMYFPEQKIGIAALMNGVGYDGAKIFRTLIRAAFGKSVEIPEFKTIEVSEDQLKAYVGEYASDTHPLGIKVMIQDGALYAQADGQGAFPLTPIDDHVFEFSAASIEMTFDPENKQFVIKQGGRADIFIDKKVKKEPPKVSVDSKTLESYVGLYKADDFPLDIEVMVKDGELKAQATGQPAFPLTPVSDTEFKFSLADIVIKFDAEKKQLAITQRGKTNIMIKE